MVVGSKELKSLQNLLTTKEFIMKLLRECRNEGRNLLIIEYVFDAREDGWV